MENKKRLIYADELKARFNPKIRDYRNCVESHRLIDSCPTVDAVEVVHGRWKNGDCTACGFDIRDMIDGESEFNNWVWEGLPYCPNCGAKMDGDVI